MDQKGKPNLRKFSFDEELGIPSSAAKLADLEQRERDLEKRERKIYELEKTQAREASLLAAKTQVPSGRVQVLNFINGSGTSTSLYGIQRSEEGLIILTGDMFRIQICSARTYAGKILDLYIKASGYIGAIRFIMGDCVQFDGPLEMLNRYKGAAMREAKCVVRPGCPCTLEGKNVTPAQILISEASLVLEIDPELEKNGYRDW